jgi:hypothetical protein
MTTRIFQFIGRGLVFTCVVCGVLGPITACKETSFSGSSPKKPAEKPQAPAVPAPSQTPVPQPAPGDIEETFQLDGEVRSPLDLVWVIDNSGSMTDNIAQVRQNFDAFMNSLASRIDVKIILISKAQGSLGLQLPAAAVAQGGVQVDYSVGSNDPALLAAAMSCTVTGSGSSYQFCGVPVTVDSYSGSAARAVSGRIMQAFRPGAARGYVFVTDDESEDMTGPDFIKAVTASAKGVTPKIFSFRGITEQTGSQCDISAVGVQYGVMEQASQGSAFDICVNNWSPSFANLAETIKTQAKSDIILKGNFDPATIKVYLDNQLLQPNEYQIMGNSILITKVLDKSKNYTARVAYQPRKN